MGADPGLPPGTVLLCVGQPLGPPPKVQQQEAPEGAPSLRSPAATEISSETPVTVYDMHVMSSQRVALSDAITLARLAGFLQAKGRGYHIRGMASTSFADLRDGPVVLIGGNNNDWTKRLTGQLRFSFQGDLKTSLWIQDRQHPSKRDWAVNPPMPYSELNEDYAVISRVLDPTIDRVVVVAAGISKYGTIAAGEFLTDSRYLEALFKEAPRDWKNGNIQAVVATRVLTDNSGVPAPNWETSEISTRFIGAGEPCPPGPRPGAPAGGGPAGLPGGAPAGPPGLAPPGDIPISARWSPLTTGFSA